MIPNVEAADVQLKGSPAKVHRDPFHQHLVLREDRVATVAPFAVASTTPNLFDAVVRQTPVPDLALMRRRRDSWSIVASRVAAAANARQIHRGLDARRRQPVRPGAGGERLARSSMLRAVLERDVSG